MRILAIDTACNLARVALTDENELIKEITVDDKRRHSVKLLPTIETLLADCRVAPKDLDMIAVTNGPGSFTGLRIGVVTAKTMAYALKIPLVGVNTLDAMAASFSSEQTIVCPLIDARNTRAYGGFYEEGKLIGGRFVRLVKDTAEAFLNQFPGRSVLFCGDGVLNPQISQILQDTLGGQLRTVSEEENPGRIEDVAFVALRQYQGAADKSAYDCNSITVDYMKDWG